MDQLFARPLKRFISNSKEYAKKHIGDLYHSECLEYFATYKKDSFIMSDYNNITSSPTKTTDESDLSRVSTENIDPFNNNSKITSNNNPEMPDTKTPINTPEKEPTAAHDQFVFNTNDDEKQTTVVKVKIIVPKKPTKQNPPATIEDEYLRRFADLVDFHERKLKESQKSPVAAPTRSNLTDSEIITDLVCNRFVVNCYEHRSLQKPKRNSGYGRLYRSLEKSTAESDKGGTKLIFVDDESAIRLDDARTSFNPVEVDKNETIITENQSISRASELSVDLDDGMTENVIKQSNSSIVKQVIPEIAKKQSNSSISREVVQETITKPSNLLISRQMVPETAKEQPNSLISRQVVQQTATKPYNALISKQVVPETSTKSSDSLISTQVVPEIVITLSNSVISDQTAVSENARQLSNSLISKQVVDEQPNIAKTAAIKPSNSTVVSAIKHSNSLISDQTSSLNYNALPENAIKSNSGLRFEEIASNDIKCISIDEPDPNKINEKYQCTITDLDHSDGFVSGSDSYVSPRCGGAQNNKLYSSNDACSEISTADFDSHLSDISSNSDHFSKENLQGERVSSPIPAGDSECGMDLSYDMDDFLKRALGDEIHNYSSFNKTNLEEPKKSPSSLKETSAEDSMCTSDASELVSNRFGSFQSNFYRSMTKKLWKVGNSFRHSHVPKEVQEVGEREMDSLFAGEKTGELIRLASVQSETMKQITKALLVCQNTKEFIGSLEQVEGERLLLIATQKRKIILDEIRRQDYEMNETSTLSSLETGTMTVSNIRFPPKTVSAEFSNRRDHNQWFMCILSQGLNVAATEATIARPDGSVEFSDEISFKDLPSDFAVNVEIYSFLQGRGFRNYSHESKYHLKETKSKLCPSPKKLLQKDKYHTLPNRYENGVKTSSFKLCGAMKLRVGDLAKSGPWQMQNVPLCSTLTGKCAIRLQSSVAIPIRHSGFLDVGTEIGNSTSWNRRWCLLDGSKFSYWNYPRDEESKPPIKKIDLRRCVNARVETADRTICARPRSLLVETAMSCNDLMKNLTEKHSISIDRYFLASDTLSEMNTWKLNLNSVIFAIRTWNVSQVY